jgi:hypothetical protein
MGQPAIAVNMNAMKHAMLPNLMLNRVPIALVIEVLLKFLVRLFVRHYTQLR